MARTNLSALRRFVGSFDHLSHAGGTSLEIAMQKSDASPEFLCHLCGNPVHLCTAKTDGNGNTVHDDCYAQHVISRMQLGEFQ